MPSSASACFFFLCVCSTTAVPPPPLRLRALILYFGKLTPSFFSFPRLFFFISLMGWSQLGAAGEAFFVERVHNPLRRDLVTSPLSSPLREGQEGGAEAGGGDGGGGGGGRPWEESAGQDDWES